MNENRFGVILKVNTNYVVLVILDFIYTLTRTKNMFTCKFACRAMTVVCLYVFREIG